MLIRDPWEIRTIIVPRSVLTPRFFMALSELTLGLSGVPSKAGQKRKARIPNVDNDERPDEYRPLSLTFYAKRGKHYHLLILWLGILVYLSTWEKNSTYTLLSNRIFFSYFNSILTQMP